jgi:hypothetical protein
VGTLRLSLHLPFSLCKKGTRNKTQRNGQSTMLLVNIVNKKEKRTEACYEPPSDFRVFCHRCLSLNAGRDHHAGAGSRIWATIENPVDLRPNTMRDDPTCHPKDPCPVLTRGGLGSWLLWCSANPDPAPSQSRQLERDQRVWAASNHIGRGA